MDWRHAATTPTTSAKGRQSRFVGADADEPVDVADPHDTVAAAAAATGVGDGVEEVADHLEADPGCGVDEVRRAAVGLCCRLPGAVGIRDGDLGGPLRFSGNWLKEQGTVSRARAGGPEFGEPIET